jgi:hypothetical protein
VIAISQLVSFPDAGSIPSLGHISVATILVGGLRLGDGVAWPLHRMEEQGVGVGAELATAGTSCSASVHWSFSALLVSDAI